MRNHDQDESMTQPTASGSTGVEVPPDNVDRQRIAEELDTTMLVEAGAGTGKTTSMIARMVALLREGKCQIDTLAAVTFTRKAAAEMRARFQVALERAARDESGPSRQRLVAAVAHTERCFIGTIHSFCTRLLRERPIEAGVDLVFKELEPEEDKHLMEEAWREYVAELFACDNGLLAELVELGLQIEHLRPAYQSYVLFPDVEAWPAPEVQLTDLRPAVKQLRDYVQHMETLLPTFPDDRGNDKLMRKYESVVWKARQLDWKRFADLMGLLENFGNAGAVQSRWPGGNAQGKQEKNRWEEFTERYAKPLVKNWQEKRYASVLRVLEQAKRRYDQRRTVSGGLNYQDLLILAARLLKDKPAIRRYFRRRFTHVCVDEFQDTDPVQAQVMMYLVACDAEETDWRQCRPVPGSMFVVGDPKQSIYRFRRADIVTYNQVKQIIENSGGVVIALTSNFRTVSHLVEWGNEIFDNVFPYAADAYSPARRPMLIGRKKGRDGELAGIWKVTVPQDYRNAGDVIEYEADRIARSIRHALDSEMTVPRTVKEIEQGLSTAARPGDFLIVSRNKWNLAVFARKLQELEVPYQVTGSSALNQVPELTLLANCLAALVEPDNPVALVAVLRGDLFGFSDQVLFAYREAQGSFSYRSRIPEQLPNEVAGLFGDAFGRLQRYASWLNQLPPVSALERIAVDLGLTAQAAASPGGDIQAGTMAKVFEMLRGVQVECYSVADLVEYLQEWIEKEVELDSLPVKPYQESVVRIMNLHKVKGLEAPVVYLAGATGKKFRDVRLHVDRSGAVTKGYLAIFGPQRGRGGAPLLARPAGWDEFAGEEKRFRDAEEQRLLYVAATRAGTQLTIVQREKGGQKNPWQFFEPAIMLDQELNDPGSQVPPTRETIVLDQEAVSGVSEGIAARWQVAERSNYAMATAKEISITPSRFHPVADRGEHGTEWGTVIHSLLETAMRAPKLDLNKTARMTLVEQQLNPAMAPLAVRVVKQVIGSEVWRRARKSQQRLVEVPLETCIGAEQSDESVPTVLRGVIDLAFLEPDGWVLVDYKTDAAAEDHLKSLIDHYRGQVDLYAHYWQKIVGQTVKEKGLYFTAGGQYVTV